MIYDGGLSDFFADLLFTERPHNIDRPKKRYPKEGPNAGRNARPKPDDAPDRVQ